MVDSQISFEHPNFEIVDKYEVTLEDPNIARDDKGNEGLCAARRV